jgi:hypothetical protein
MPYFHRACHIELIIQLDLFIDKAIPFALNCHRQTARNGLEEAVGETAAVLVPVNSGTARGRVG